MRLTSSDATEEPREEATIATARSTRPWWTRRVSLRAQRNDDGGAWT